MLEFQLHDYVAAIISGSAVVIYIGLLIYNGYDDYRKGREYPTWRKQA